MLWLLTHALISTAVEVGYDVVSSELGHVISSTQKDRLSLQTHVYFQQQLKLGMDE